MMEFNLKRFTFRGQRVSYVDEGSGPIMVFIHNSGQSHRIFDPQLRHFVETNRVIAMDWLGFGASDKPRSVDYNADLYLAQLNALSEHLGLERFHLVGCCVGGGIALLYSRRYPKKVSSLTTVTIATPGLARSGILGPFLAKPGTMRHKIQTWLSQSSLAHRFVFTKIMSTQIGRAGLSDHPYAQSVSDGYANKDVRFAFSSFDYHSLAEIESAEPAVDFPSHLVIWGEDNPVLRVKQGATLAVRWNAIDALFIAGCGYGVLRQAPMEVNAAIERHISRAFSKEFALVDRL